MIKKIVKKFVFWFYAIAMISLFLLAFVVLVDESLVKDVVTINQLAILGLMLAVTPSIGYAANLLGPKKLNRYKVTGKCQNCQHETVLKMEQIS